MNHRKICFIICVNHERYFEECLYYLNHLWVPEDYEVDILAIREANSMAAGYNEGMRGTDAKYKIYMHQDVFIVNRNFLGELLDIFQDASIGMAGMIGSPELPESAVMWLGDRIGAIYSNDIVHSVIWQYNRGLCDVEAVDGLLMATQYDVPWREDIFTGWDFYDVSQSFEFRRKGYRVVVPDMKEPWCMHDDGFLKMTDYNNARLKFLAEYGKKDNK